VTTHDQVAEERILPDRFPFNVHEHPSPASNQYIEVIPGVLVHFRSAYLMLFAARPDLAAELNRRDLYEVHYPFIEESFLCHEFMAAVVNMLENSLYWQRQRELRAERDAARKGEGEAEAEAATMAVRSGANH
jgi:hypothetical protein